MRHPNFDIVQFTEALEGTCKSLNEQLQNSYPDMDEDYLTEEDYAYIDSQIFRCEACGWWYFVDEMVQDGLCPDCSSDS